jgi:DNA polymerase III subunit delta
MLDKEFFRHLERGPMAPVYLFAGDADLLLEEAWKRLEEKSASGGTRKFKGERFQAKDYTAAEMVAGLRTLPMFAPKRLLMVQHIENWLEEQRKILLAYLARPFSTACLVLTFAGKKGLEKIEAAVEAVGTVVHFRAPSERELPRWLQEKARQHGKNLSFQAAMHLSEQVGTDLYRLESELEKLITYVGDREAIEADDVLQAVSSQRAHTIFELLDGVAERKSGRALAMLRSLLAEGQVPLVILAMIARHVRNLWQVKSALEAGMPLPQITRKFGIHQYVAGKHAQQAPRFSEAELFRMHRAVCDADFALKSTGTNPEALLENLVLGMCFHNDKAPGRTLPPRAGN